MYTMDSYCSPVCNRFNIWKILINKIILGKRYGGNNGLLWIIQKKVVVVNTGQDFAAMVTPEDSCVAQTTTTNFQSLSNSDEVGWGGERWETSSNPEARKIKKPAPFFETREMSLNLVSFFCNMWQDTLLGFAIFVVTEYH